jgi:hypothetical protein
MAEKNIILCFFHIQAQERVKVFTKMYRTYVSDDLPLPYGTKLNTVTGRYRYPTVLKYNGSKRYRQIM